ncbi:endo-1,4-beta-xylanase [Candidatus Gottesmanbacteria bacterium]|nr:endo-1,4-beta-xylanase [Candidatus Gottesmanbacteria bacterium]
MIIFTPLDNTVQFTSPWCHLTDENGLPCAGQISFTADGIVCKSSKDRISLNLLFLVPGFGEIMLRTNIVNNNGQKIILEEALIRGRVDQINKIGTGNDIKKIDFLLMEGIKAVKSQNRLIIQKVLRALLFLGEKIAVKKAKKDLQEKNSNLKIKFGGQAFLLPSSTLLQKRFREIFDFGVVPTYFFMTQPKKGIFDFSMTKEITKILKKQNISIKGHPLVWLHQYATPIWIKELNFSELKKVIIEHIDKVLRHFGREIFMWDIINEFNASDANGQNLSINQLLELTKLISDQVHTINPEIKRVLNFSEIFGVGSAIGNKTSVPMEHFLDLCVKHNVGFEAIGFQLYLGIRKEFTCRELLDISLFFDRFTRFGKQLHLTELGFPSKFAIDPNCFFKFDHPAGGGWWHKPWTETIQAEFLDKIILIFASKHLATSITWWDIADIGSNKDISCRFLPFSGLLRRDLTPKPAWHIFEKWRSKL